MEVGFKYQEAQKPEPVRIEQVFAEKPGGGLVANPDYDVPPTSAVGYDAATGLYKPIKAYKLVDRVHFDNEYYRHDIGKRALSK